MSDTQTIGPSGFGFSNSAEDVTDGMDLTGKTYLVTGCNSGLGLETTRVLAARGAHVIGLARTKEKAQKAFADLGLGDEAATAVACELSNLASVKAAVAQVAGLGRSIDALIANAGIMALPEVKQQDGVELQFFTNHVGHFVLVTGLVDQLSADGRVVMLSSGAHHMAHENGIEFDNLSGEADYHPWRMYGNSKLANILFARSLARQFAAAGSKKTANAVHPGVIQTNLSRNIPTAEAEVMFENIKKRVTLKDVGQGASTQVYVATSPALADVSGKYFQDNNESPTNPLALDDAMADKLWAVTEEIVARVL